MGLKLAKEENGYVGDSSNFFDTIFLGKWIKNSYAAIGILSHDSLHIALGEIGEYPHFHPIQPYIRGCLGVRGKWIDYPINKWQEVNDKKWDYWLKQQKR